MKMILGVDNYNYCGGGDDGDDSDSNPF